MPQFVIDPRDIGTPESHPINVIHPSVRQFGYAPDLRLCQPGDLILSFPVNPGLIDGLILDTQTQIGLRPEDARWTHAAIFLYEDNVLEADPWKGVATRSLYDNVDGTGGIPGKHACVLRVCRNNQEPLVRAKIALCAQRMLGQRYSKSKAISAGVRSLIGAMRHRWS